MLSGRGSPRYGVVGLLGDAGYLGTLDVLLEEVLFELRDPASGVCASDEVPKRLDGFQGQRLVVKTGHLTPMS
jgi:hypothetical protein